MNYKVDVTRTSYSTKTFEVEAENPKQAQYLAEQLAYNTEFKEDNAEYTIGLPVQLIGGKPKYKKTYYQPELYYKEDDYIVPCGTPDGLASFEVFLSENTAELWLENHGYCVEDFTIVQYHDDDIEDPTVIDEYGNMLEN